VGKHPAVNVRVPGEPTPEKSIVTVAEAGPAITSNARILAKKIVRLIKLFLLCPRLKCCHYA
jgi:hypothetical protein